ncbi:MAG TPA: tetratricopeptide repeat protein [bacterium]|nr:tetratricopeptide repeat protein [bacterium]
MSVLAVILSACSSAPIIKDANYYYQKGVGLAENDHFDEAIQCFSKVVKLDPRHATARYNLGVMYDEKMMPKEAAAEYRAAIGLDPRAYEAWYKLGVIQVLEGDDRGAMASFRETIRIEPRHQGAHYNLAVLCSEQGQIDKAIEHYKASVDANPENYQALNNLGLLYEKKGYPQLAVECFKKSKRAQPGSCEAYNNLGVMYAKKGKYDDAARQFQQAVEIDQKNADGYYNLAYIYKDHVRDYTKARKAIVAFLKLRPDSPKAAEMKAAMRDIDRTLAQAGRDLHAQKSEAILKDVARFIESVNGKNFIDFYDLQPEEMRAHIPKEQWQRDMTDLSDERLENQRRSLLELLGFYDISGYRVSRIEMVSGSKAKVTIAVAYPSDRGGVELREKTTYWDEYNGRWAPSQFISRVKMNWEAAKEQIERAGD